MALDPTVPLTGLDDRGRTRVADAFVDDPDLADGLARMLDALACDFQRTVVRRLAMHLQTYASPMKEGRTERDALLRRHRVMNADRFEVLVFELAARGMEGVRRLTAPDGGADTLRPATPNDKAKVWQAKRYPDQINWEESEKSLDRAVAVWEPESIVFAFTRDFTEPAEKSFQSKLVERESAAGVGVTAWTLTRHS